MLTGETDNPYAIGANIVLSFIPIEGEVLDLIALFVDPTVWGKAFALIGLVASLISDGAQILTALGLAVPPALAALPAAVGAEAVDVGAAILRHVKKLVDAEVYKIIREIGFDQALKLGGDLLGHLAQRAVKAVGGAEQWPEDIFEVISLIQSVLSSVWDPFVALLKHYGTGGLGKLVELGFGDGGFLAGRVLHLSDEAAGYTDDILETIVRIGDELGETAAELSDEAVGGLGKLAKTLPGERVQRVVSNLCIGGITHLRVSRGPGLASPLPQQVCDLELFQKVLTNIKQFNQTALDGFERLVVQSGIDEETLGNFLKKYADDGVTSNKILSVIGSSNQTWSKLSFDGLVKMTDDIGIEEVETVVQSYSEQVIEQTFRTIRTTSAQWSRTGLEGVAKMIDRLDQPLVEQILNRQGRGEFGNQVFTWLNKVGDSSAAQGNNFREWAHSLSVRGNTYVGAVFELRYAADELVDDGISVISDRKNGKLAMDFIMNDGRHIELKNWGDYGSGKRSAAAEQFRANLLSLDENNNPIIDPVTETGEAGRYGDRIYEYVFRGPYNADIVQDLLEVAEEARTLKVLRRPFTADNIRFLEETTPFP